MRLIDLNLSPRCLALVLALALASSAMVVLVPATAVAGCGYDLQVRIYYYSDPELTNYVGECFKPCWAGMICSGEQTEYGQAVSAQSCPPRCN